MKLYSKFMTSAVVMMAAGVLSSNAQFYDDIYYNPKKTNTVKAEVKYVEKNTQPKKNEATVYIIDKDNNTNSNIVNGRDIDEYNRRYTSNYEYGTGGTSTDSITVAIADLQAYDNSDDYQYSRRIQAFYNPTIVIETQPATDAFTLGYSAGLASSFISPYSNWYYPYHYPYSTWGWNNWGPYASWNWRYSWNYGWDPFWGPNYWSCWDCRYHWHHSWSWDYHWGPNYWGHRWAGPSWGRAPAPRPPHVSNPGYQPGYNQNGRRPFGTNSATPSTSTPLGNRRPSASRSTVSSSRPGYATDRNNNAPSTNATGNVNKQQPQTGSGNAKSSSSATRRTGSSNGSMVSTPSNRTSPSSVNQSNSSSSSATRYNSSSNSSSNSTSSSSFRSSGGSSSSSSSSRGGFGGGSSSSTGRRR